MNVILDTHGLLWLWTDSPNLSESARKIYVDPQNRLYASLASLWEIGIKKSLGKIKLKEGWGRHLASFLGDNGIQWLDIRPEHCHQVSVLPFHHRDPFDRMIASQALVENFFLLTRDEKMKAYGVQCLW